MRTDLEVLNSEGGVNLNAQMQHMCRLQHGKHTGTTSVHDTVKTASARRSVWECSSVNGGQFWRCCEEGLPLVCDHGAVLLLELQLGGCTRLIAAVQVYGLVSEDSTDCLESVVTILSVDKLHEKQPNESNRAFKAPAGSCALTRISLGSCLSEVWQRAVPSTSLTVISWSLPPRASLFEGDQPPHTIDLVCLPCSALFHTAVILHAGCTMIGIFFEVLWLYRRRLPLMLPTASYSTPRVTAVDATIAVSYQRAISPLGPV